MEITSVIITFLPTRKTGLLMQRNGFMSKNQITKQS